MLAELPARLCGRDSHHPRLVKNEERGTCYRSQIPNRKSLGLASPGRLPTTFREAPRNGSLPLALRRRKSNLTHRSFRPINVLLDTLCQVSGFPPSRKDSEITRFISILLHRCTKTSDAYLDRISNRGPNHQACSLIVTVPLSSILFLGE